MDAFPNGVVSYIADMATQLKKMRHKITIVTGDAIGKTQDGEVYQMQLSPPIDAWHDAYCTRFPIESRRSGQRINCTGAYVSRQFGVRLLNKAFRSSRSKKHLVWPRRYAGRSPFHCAFACMVPGLSTHELKEFLRIEHSSNVFLQKVGLLPMRMACLPRHAMFWTGLAPTTIWPWTMPR